MINLVQEKLQVIIEVTGHFVPRSFCTQVISYYFDHFVPRSFRTHFSLFVPSSTGYEMTFESHFVSKSFHTYFGHFVPRIFVKRFGHFLPSLVISHLVQLSTKLLLKVISYLF